MARILIMLVLFAAFGLAACSPPFQETPTPDPVEPVALPEDNTNQQTGMGMGMGGDMMARHHATIPVEYAGMTNPLQGDEDSVERGAELYKNYCVTCHGDGGMGDGPAGQTLDPLPAPISHTSRMLGDDYLFWRISEGGLHEPFSSAMPRWQDVMDDEARWDVINYVRALASGQIKPGQTMGGAIFDAETEAAQHAEMADQGVRQGVISQTEADTFLAVHTELDAIKVAEMEGQSGGMESMQSLMLAQLLTDALISQEEAEMFTDVHDSLMAAGLME